MTLQTLSIAAIYFVAFTTTLPAQDKPLPPAEAAKHMTLPPGFKATLFAGEPDVIQPIAFTFDDRGRLWVAECYSYPKWQTDGKPGRDRILIFEDTKGTGHFDVKKVFHDKIANVSGIAYGFGGVWVCATPNLLFIPDRDGDDVPDGPPLVVLDGWDVLKAQHNVFNSLTWGPDGWLYGCNGIQSNSNVGKPGTPDKDRVRMNCGVWRYHPTKKIFEAVAHGTTNPWGLDFDDYGQMFITNCVIKHVFHVVPGGHYERMYGQDLNPHVYGLMQSCADHIHWGGGHWTESRGGKGAHDSPGGGHAHSGCMIYLGDNWPDQYRNGLFTCNLHGNRINHDLLERKGSGYVAHHGKDFLLANDPWFRGLAIQYGPDGGVFVSDWCDTGECHNYQTVDQTNGRIYKITYGDVKPFKGDLAKLSDDELVKLQLHKNEWLVRHARRILQERAAAGKLAAGTHEALRRMIAQSDDVTHSLRALWALHVTRGLDKKQLISLMRHWYDRVRGWAVRLALESPSRAAEVSDYIADLAREEKAACVRMEISAALQRLPFEDRWGIATDLVTKENPAVAKDGLDADLSLMAWFGIQPAILHDKTAVPIMLLVQDLCPLVRENTARLMVETDRTGIDTILDIMLHPTADEDLQRDLLTGIQTALAGRRDLPLPKDWAVVHKRLNASSLPGIRERATRLAVLFGDHDAIAAVTKVVIDSNGNLEDRTKALESLLSRRNRDLFGVLVSLLQDKLMRPLAIRGLAAYSDATTPSLILNLYSSLTAAEKTDAIETLASRPHYAAALLDAVEQGKVARRDISAFTVRQIQAFKDKNLSARLAKVWGTIRPASQEKAALTAKYKSLLTPDYLKTANVANGRQLFNRTCASCHVLFDAGNKIGPELTGGQRANLDYILENVLDPSAIVPADYQVTLLQTKDGRVITGIIKSETDKVVTIQTQNDQLRVPVNEIEERQRSPLSLMPDGLFAGLKDEEVRDLVGYLASPVQVALPKEESKRRER